MRQWSRKAPHLPGTPFYNLDEKADSLYDAGLSRLEDLYTQMASIPENERPVVAFGMVFGGVVYTQAGNSTIAKQLERAGAVYALKDLEAARFCAWAARTHSSRHSTWN